MRKRYMWVAGPRTKSSQFSGLECILSSAAPLFIASVSAAVQLKDAPEAEHLVQGVTSQDKEEVSVGQTGKDQDAGALGTKKANRKNKKQFNNNRIGGGDDAY
jgi:hypothetical protein